MIHPPEILDGAIGQIAGQIACLIEARPRLRFEWVWNELLRGQLRPVEIPSRQTNPPNVQFARHADGGRLQMPVQDVDLCVGYRATDGNCPQRALTLASPIRHVHGRLRRAI